MAASHCTYTSRNAQAAVQNRYARWPIASPSAKYSNSASTIIRASASATHAVEPHSTSPTTNGINTTAVATRFQVIWKESPRRTARRRLTVESRKLKEKEKEKEITDRRHARAPWNRRRLRECRRSAARAFETPRKPRAAARD